MIPHGDFTVPAAGSLPAGWAQVAARLDLAPLFRLEQKNGQQLLLVTGGGNPDCVGYLKTQAAIELGKTYLLKTRFQISEGFNPQESLLIQCFASTKDGIHQFRRLGAGWVEGEAKLMFPGKGTATAEIRILFRLSADGKAWFRNISLTQTDPVQPRWVRVACTSGQPTLKDCAQALDAGGRAKADIALLSEYMQGSPTAETIDGPSAQLMAAKARQYRMYVAGGIVRKVEKSSRRYNTALLFDREGTLIGSYDKIHPYSPELNEEGITPGRAVRVFKTDFGKVGMMICYDSWFGDVSELLSLKGAELILFPNAGYYRSLMPARAADNRVRIVSSSWHSGAGVWDTAGRSLQDPEGDPTYQPAPGLTFKDVVDTTAGNLKLLIVSLDLTCSPSPHHNGGSMMQSPGGQRNRREQSRYLEDEIAKERARWWVE